MNRQATAFLLMFTLSCGICLPAALTAEAHAGGSNGADEFLTKLYDSLHDTPMQRKIRELAPVPFGVVFLPWKGMTEQDMREHFRLMKKLGFNTSYKEIPGAHFWFIWRDFLGDFGAKLFR